jgi:hypothetical protein
MKEFVSLSRDVAVNNNPSVVYFVKERVYIITFEGKLLIENNGYAQLEVDKELDWI